MSASNKINKCSHNTLRLLATVIVLYVGYLAIGYYYYKPSNNAITPSTTLINDIEQFTESVDNTLDTVRRYRDVFNEPTNRKLNKSALDVRRITLANQAIVDRELEELQGRISMLVDKMNTGLYRQMQRNYRVAHDTAVKREHTDLSNLPTRGI